MCHWLFRRDKLCPGTRSCGEAQQQTGGEEACLECPSAKLDTFLETTQAGMRIASVLRLDRLRHCGVVFDPHDIDYAESLLLDLLNQERDLYTDDQMKQAQKRR